MVKTSKNHVKSYLAVLVTALMLLSVIAPAMTVSAASNLYSSTESFSSLEIVDGQMTSDTGNATLVFTNDTTKGNATFSTDTYRLQVKSAPNGTAKMEYILPEAVSGKVEVSFEVYLPAYAGMTIEDMVVAKNSDGNNILDIDFKGDIFYLFDKFWTDENSCSTGCGTNPYNSTWFFGSSAAASFRNVKFVLDFDNGLITFYQNGELATHGDPAHTYTMKLLNGGKNLKSLVFNLPGGYESSDDTAATLDDIAINQLAKREKLYTSTEEFKDLNIVNGEMISDTGNATLVFTNDTTKGNATFSTDTYRLQVKSAPNGTAKMEYILPEAVSGKVEVSFEVYLPAYANMTIEDMVVAKNSDGNNILDIDFKDKIFYLFDKFWTDENSCSTGCGTSPYDSTWFFGSSAAVSYRNVKFVLDFDNGLITFYQNGELATHGDPAHTYTMKLLNGGKNLKSLVFNLPGGYESSDDTAATLDDIAITQITKGIAKSSVSDASVYHTADANKAPLEELTAGDAVTVSAKLKSQATSAQNVRMYVALYNSANELVQVVFADNSVESGAEATLTKDLTVSSDIGIGGYMRVFVWNQNLVPFDAVTELYK